VVTDGLLFKGERAIISRLSNPGAPAFPAAHVCVDVVSSVSAHDGVLKHQRSLPVGGFVHLNVDTYCLKTFHGQRFVNCNKILDLFARFSNRGDYFVINTSE
jgi:hypothetical protein